MALVTASRPHTLGAWPQDAHHGGAGGLGGAVRPPEENPMRKAAAVAALRMGNVQRSPRTAVNSPAKYCMARSISSETSSLFASGHGSSMV